MTPLELIDQILGRQKEGEEFRCSRAQMLFIRDLVISHSDPKALKVAAGIRHKKLLAELRRQRTDAKKAYEAAEKNLKEAEKL